LGAKGFSFLLPQEEEEERNNGGEEEAGDSRDGGAAHMGSGASAGRSAASGAGGGRASGASGGGASGASGAGSGRGSGLVGVDVELDGEVQEGGGEGVLVDGGADDLVDGEVVDAASEASGAEAVTNGGPGEGVVDLGAKTHDGGSRVISGDPEVVAGGSDGSLVDESDRDSISGSGSESVHVANSEIFSVLDVVSVEESSGTNLIRTSGAANGASGENATSASCGRGDNDDNSGVGGREANGATQVSNEGLSVENNTLGLGSSTLCNNRDSNSRNKSTTEGTGVLPVGYVSAGIEKGGIELDNLGRWVKLGRNHAEEEAKSKEDGKLSHYEV
jgi:hypothetical protein